jgi:hypothetical protein
MKDFGETSAGLPNGSQVPTYNATTTWVKTNHTIRFGAEFRTEGYTAPNAGNDAIYIFATDQTGEPFQITPRRWRKCRAALCELPFGLGQTGEHERPDIA